MVVGVIRIQMIGVVAPITRICQQAGFVFWDDDQRSESRFGSRRKLFGNNPIVWTFLGEISSIVLDMAMTPVALGKVLRARSEGNDIPESWDFRP